MYCGYCCRLLLVHWHLLHPRSVPDCAQGHQRCVRHNVWLAPRRFASERIQHVRQSHYPGCHLHHVLYTNIRLSQTQVWLTLGLLCPTISYKP